MNEDSVVKVPQFKKRTVKAKLKKAESNTVDDRDHDIVDPSTLEDLRFEQEMRRKNRTSGVDAAKTLNAGKKKEKLDESNKKESNSNANATAIGSGIIKREHVSQVQDLGVEKVTKHEDIMEKYVREKLGIDDTGNASNGNSTSTNANDTTDDGNKSMSMKSKEEAELYSSLQITKSLNNGNGVNLDSNAESESDVGAVYAGLVEVQLPSSYALNNIKQTEITKQKINDNKRKRYHEKGEGGPTGNGSGSGGLATLGYKSKDGGYDGKSDRYQKPMGREEWKEAEQRRVQMKAAKSGSLSGAIPHVPTSAEIKAETERGGTTSTTTSSSSIPVNSHRNPTNTHYSDNRLLDEHKKRMRR